MFLKSVADSLLLGESRFWAPPACLLSPGILAILSALACHCTCHMISLSPLTQRGAVRLAMPCLRAIPCCPGSHGPALQCNMGSPQAVRTAVSGVEALLPALVASRYFADRPGGLLLAELRKGMLAADPNRERPFPGSLAPTMLDSWVRWSAVTSLPT